jgi:hypothetical protein
MKEERNSGTSRRTAEAIEGRIDAALRSLGAAAPEPGLEGRILTRVAAARMDDAQFGGPLTHRPRRLAGALKPLAGFTCASVLCTLIVVGSVNHKRRTARGAAPPAPVLQMPGTGVGAASAMHPAGPAPSPAPAGNAGRGHAAHHERQGRARIAPHARKAPGVAVPAPAGAPQN